MTFNVCITSSLLLLLLTCTADCSAALQQDPNCEECGFDSLTSGLPVCTMCRIPYIPGPSGKCEMEGKFFTSKV